jgi:hypothetical protein
MELATEGNAIVPQNGAKRTPPEESEARSRQRGLRRLDEKPESLDGRPDVSLDGRPSVSLNYQPSAETLDKWVPDKGDTTDCQSIIDRWNEHLEDNEESTRMPPCRNGTIVDDTGTFVEKDPSDMGFIASADGTDTDPILNAFRPDSNEASEELLKRRNAVSVGFAVALRPGSVPHPFIVTRIVTSVLNEAMDDIDFFVAQRRELEKGEEKESRETEGPLLEAKRPYLSHRVHYLSHRVPLLSHEAQFYDQRERLLRMICIISLQRSVGRRLPTEWWWRMISIYLLFLETEIGIACYRPSAVTKYCRRSKRHDGSDIFGHYSIANHR